MKKQLKLKLIVTANLDNLKVSEFKNKANSMITGQIKNPAYVPGITPTPNQVNTELETLNGLMAQCKQLEFQLKTNTGQIRDQVRKMKNIFVSEWAPQIQQAPGMDAAKVKGLGYGLRGQFNGKSLPEFDMTNSEPVILRIDLTMSLKQILIIRNSKMKGRKLPHDAKRCEVYRAFGDNEPSDIRKMTYLGTASGGKFVSEFTTDDIGKWVWYIVVYIGKKRGTFPVMSRAEKVMVA